MVFRTVLIIILLGVLGSLYEKVDSLESQVYGEFATVDDLESQVNKLKSQVEDIEFTIEEMEDHNFYNWVLKN